MDWEIMPELYIPWIIPCDLHMPDIKDHPELPHGLDFRRQEIK